MIIKIQVKDLPDTKTPVLSYCRQLIKEGYDPKTRLEVYRNNLGFDIAVSEIGLGAQLTVKEHPRLRFARFTDPSSRLRG